MSGEDVMASEMMDRIALVINQYKYTHDEYPLARLILQAMREPTEAMILAGVHHDNMGDMAGRWRAMIDAALANPSETPNSSESAE
jgi:hypothetical protein